jgi:hypothetical protein
MKNILTTIFFCASVSVYAQNGTTGSTKPVSNPDLPNNLSSSNNSNSGVNPNGNPGTIINATANSNSTNQGLIQPIGVPPTPAYYNLPPDTVPLRTWINTNDSVNMVMNADTLTSQAFVPGDSILIEPEFTPADAPVIMDTQNIVTSGVAPQNNNTGMENNKAMEYSGFSETQLIGLTRYAALPQLSTWVPENVVSSLSSRYGNNLYDITMVKTAEDNKHHYIVRTQENGLTIWNKLVFLVTGAQKSRAGLALLSYFIIKQLLRTIRGK